MGYTYVIKCDCWVPLVTKNNFHMIYTGNKDI